MAIKPVYSPQLRQVYNGDVSGLRPIPGVLLRHSSWAEIVAITSHYDDFEAYLDGELRLFEAVPTASILPSKSPDGDQSMSMVFNGVESDVIARLKAAIDSPQEPIEVVYSEYFVGNQAPQIDPPYRLYLTSLVLNGSTLTGTASRPDIINRPFPNRIFRIDEFPGLLR